MKSKEEYILKLEEDLKIRRYSPQTIHRYKYVVENYLDYMKLISNKKIEEMDEYDVIKYLNYLTEERNYKPSSYNNINAILKFFLETTLEKNIGYKRLPNAKLEVRIKVTPNKGEIAKIIENTENIKHKCWYALAYGSGLRVSEIAKLKVTDIDSKAMKIKVVGKGNKERITVLPEVTLKYLREYCKREKITKEDNYLFKGQGKKHISEASISCSLKQKVKELGMDERITIHSLRRSFATHLLKMGESIEVVKEIMGHNSITTTSRYAQVVSEETKIKNPLDSELYEIRN